MGLNDMLEHCVLAFHGNCAVVPLARTQCKYQLAARIDNVPRTAPETLLSRSKIICCPGHAILDNGFPPARTLSNQNNLILRYRRRNRRNARIFFRYSFSRISRQLGLSLGAGRSRRRCRHRHLLWVHHMKNADITVRRGRLGRGRGALVEADLESGLFAWWSISLFYQLIRTLVAPEKIRTKTFVTLSFLTMYIWLLFKWC